MSSRVDLAMRTQASSDENILEILCNDLGENRLSGVEEHFKKISGVYAKNVGYLLLSLKHLSAFNIPRAKTFAARVSAMSLNASDRALVAKMHVEKVIEFTESHLRHGSFGPIFSELERQHIWHRFFDSEQHLRLVKAIDSTMMNMNYSMAIAKPIHEAMQATQRSSSAQTVVSPASTSDAFFSS